MGPSGRYDIAANIAIKHIKSWENSNGEPPRYIFNRDIDTSIQHTRLRGHLSVLIDQEVVRFEISMSDAILACQVFGRFRNPIINLTRSWTIL